MDDSVQKSCWGVTLKAVLGIGALMLAVWLFSQDGGTTSAVLAGAG
jgi:hypothetical protein